MGRLEDRMNPQSPQPGGNAQDARFDDIVVTPYEPEPVIDVPSVTQRERNQEQTIKKLTRALQYERSEAWNAQAATRWKVAAALLIGGILGVASDEAVRRFFPQKAPEKPQIKNVQKVRM